MNYLLTRASRSKLRVALACSLFFAGAVLALMSVRATPPMLSGVAPEWSIVSSPNRDNGYEGNRLASVACASASDCWSVGSYFGGNGGPYTLIEHWDGTSWTVVSSPNTAADYNELSSVTCNSASDCWAVGYSATFDVSQTLIEHWDGVSWSIVSSPNTASENDYLSGVTCNSASDCWAVGHYYPNNGFIGQTLVEHWNGVSWSIVSSPNPSPTQGGHLLSVTCSSASDCWAVGEYADDNVNLTLIERWNGTSWTIVSSPNPTQYSRLFSVACSSASDCWAVGTYHNGTYQTLIEHWNGASWAVVNSNSPGDKVLKSVTCVSGSDCWAVGYTYNPANLARSTRVEHWDGVSWSLVNSPNTAPNRENELDGVACTSSGCWAVGLFSNSQADQTLIEHWNGSSWAITASPSINHGIRGNGLDGATCTSRSNCWAVGSYSQETESPFSFAYTLIERWNGTSWQTIESPSVAGINNGLRDVACSSESDCWAVGSTYNSGVQYHQTLIEHWNGNSWSIVPSPNPTDRDRLNGVACSSASNCWAVGFVSDTSHTLTLIQHWNGSAWSVVPSPNVFSSDNLLYSVTCSSDSDCWAVGNTQNFNVIQTLIQHWNGSAWTIVASPNPFNAESHLNSITCTSALDCWAVGWGVSSGSTRTLTEHWDGVSWSAISSPNTSTMEANYLDGVACASASNCAAVGHYYSSAGVNQSLILQWDGTSWTVADSPTLSAQEPQSLGGAACVPGLDCWAVGISGSPFIERTLIERFAIPVQVTGIASRKAHGSGGQAFDLDLSHGGVECRSGGANGNYTMVFTFADELMNVGGATVASGTGSVANAAIGSDPHEYVVNLTGVSNAQVTTVTLTGGISDAAGNFSNSASASMNVLFGDVNGSGGVSASDVNLAKAQIGAVLSPNNFRGDVNANGSVTSSDINLIKTQIGTSISSNQVAQPPAIQSTRK